MSRFRKIGCIEYKRCIKVHKAVLNAALNDALPAVQLTVEGAPDCVVQYKDNMAKNLRSFAD
jgi:hypothetical protein